ncbi:Hypothetical protein PHPALM_37517 [Phytophthora palmivora]|uniref:DUF6818 domain-containing protein n=1 Tax=Phytophthora palmivora TaxID=4796 RepID=A0A2P4WX89_9STRA|nr:Hypothetical protein PHPALM_37517 [Phytophthora palmivora]
MRERVADKYNPKRARDAPERDAESLRREFRNLYKKPKPSGKGEVPARLRPVVWAMEIQMKIEAISGAHTSHDGQDAGEDDESLLAIVNETIGDNSREWTGSPRAVQTRESPNEDDDGTDSVARPNEEGSDSSTGQNFDELVSDDDSISRRMSLGTTRERDDAISQYAQRSEPSTPNTQRHGPIMTDGGPIDANLAEHCSFSDDPERSQLQVDPLFNVIQVELPQISENYSQTIT